VSVKFESEMQEIKQILDLIREFLISNNKKIKFTQYYISLGTKNFLQVVEDTFNEPTLDGNQKKEHLELLKIFLEKQKDLYFRLSFENDPQLIEMKLKIEEACKSLGFSGDNDLFLELKNTLSRIDKTEVTL